MKLTVTIRGREVLVVELQRADPAELLASAIAELAANTEDNTEEYTEDDTADDCEERTICGGSTHDFERDVSPISPDDRYAPWDDKFGFHPR